MKGEKKVGQMAANFDASNKDAMKASVKALHVLLCKEDGAWSAQGVEIDYAASGADQNEAIKNFAEGLALTIGQHLIINGNLDKVLSTAPVTVLQEWLKMPPAAISEISFVTSVEAFKEVPKAAQEFPFTGLQFVRPQKEAALAA